MNILLKIAYEGTNYHGWQAQKNTPQTICETLHNAICAVIPNANAPKGCSRTDAGVHAYEYICNFEGATNIPVERIPRAINTYLPDDIRVFKAILVPNDFNSRFALKAKTYRYMVDISPIQPPFARNTITHFPYPLNLRAMRAATKPLIGEHDFTSFCSAQDERENKTRTIHSIKISKLGDIFTFDITANAYLFNMCRIIVGTLLDVGRGKTQNMKKILEAKNRGMAGFTAPAKGLALLKVHMDRL